ncbi:hypothetical protein JX265_008839 [Neoarthrinium moseri]|uniref:Laccase n=1 Tax=Neoarthrinium moseri TaxID=1658444 RepID=A0A9P9WHC2_9PEZI|nr:uncharacterized protein JN550_009555 [Neoarthrinium moseri]KAI1848380.1 hypothetical protein JX266_005686 [Neoarthrinium moseri]KAI1863444.1 hypothetical protein JN550_009555 [Neoarthrinium moseri]KAI1863622.1 hypothetical protein JX265_008839 [Neoarthrinium moseri]
MLLSWRFGVLPLLLHGVLAADRYYNWHLTYEALGDSSKKVILINGQWPPEGIEVDLNDKIILTVTNDALNGVDEGVSVHAHGFHQRNSNDQDGPVGVTQCDIKKGGTQTQVLPYVWNAVQPGTFWVHSHHVGQYPWGLRSPLIVRSPDDPEYYGYDLASDFVVDMADTWSASMEDVENQFQTGQCCFDGRHEDLCGMEIPPDGAIVHDTLSGSCSYDALSTNGKPIRVRLINMSASSTFYVFSNDPGIDFVIIEADGTPLKNTGNPVAKSIQLHPGQRYSVLINSSKSFLLYSVIDPDQYSGNTCQQMNTYGGGNKLLRDGKRGGGGGGRAIRWNYALTAVAEFNIGGDMPTPYFEPNEYCTESSVPCYTRNDDDKSQSLVNLPAHAADVGQRLSDHWAAAGKLAPKYDVPRLTWEDNSAIITIDLTATKGTMKFANLNNKAFYSPQIPLLLRQVQAGPNCTNTDVIPQPGPDYSVDGYFGANNTFYVKRDTTVFFVVGSETGRHPFHLHGYDFQILYLGTEPRPLKPFDRFSPSGVSWPSEESIKTNSFPAPENPLRRDTLQIGSKTYAILAIKADNPGAWFLHCHNDFHSLTGMAGTVIVDSPDTDTWNSASIGQSVWDQCGFKTSSGGGFSDWQNNCCANPSSCMAGAYFR